MSKKLYVVFGSENDIQGIFKSKLKAKKFVRPYEEGYILEGELKDGGC